MALRKRSQVEVVGARESRVIAGTLGRDMRATRRRLRMTQAQLGGKVGLSHTRIGEMERGEGDTAQIGTWVRIGLALDRPLAVAFSRDIREPGPIDAGHLAAQKLLLRLARRAGRSATFELPTRPMSPSLSVDVGIRDDAARALVLIEVWNRFDDVGRAARTQDHKLGEASALARLAGGDDRPYRVAACWALVDTAANRALVRTYPEILRARFSGSSRQWVEALNHGRPIPVEPALVWVDPRAARLTEVRLRS